MLSPRSINWPIDIVFGGGIAHTSDGGSTARAASNEPVEASDSWKHMTARFEVGFDAFNAEGASKFQQQQIEKQIKFQAMDKLRSYRRAMAIGFYGHSTGIVFLAEGTASNPSGTNTKVRVNDLYGEAGLAVPSRIRDYITVNKDYVNVHSGTTTTVRGGGKVTAIDESNNDLTIATSSDISGSVADGDAIVLFNQVKSGAADDMDLWINGMLDITRATTLHGISSSSQPDWVAGVDESSFGSALSGQKLYEFFTDIEQRSDHPVEWVYTTTGVIAAAGGPELDQRRYGADTDTLVLGFKNLKTMGVDAKSRPFVPSGYAFLGSNSALRKLSPDESDTPSNIVSSAEGGDGFQQYEDTLGFYKDTVFRSQLTAVSRLGLGVIDGITEAA